MTNIYPTDFYALAVDSLPPVQRTTENKLLVKWLVNSQALLYDHFLYSKLGAENYISIWYSSGYYYGDMVIYFPTGEVYECSVGVTVDEPTTSTDWRKVEDSFLGNDYAQHFNGTRIQLEYALNKRFFLNFSPVTNASDIYIVRQTRLYPFISGGTENNSSSCFLHTSTEFCSDEDDFSLVYNFKIMYPAADYALLGTEAESIVRGFVDKIVTAGKTYSIETY